MDAIWRRIMERVQANPLMSDVAETAGLLEELQKCNRSLDIVEKVCAYHAYVCLCILPVVLLWNNRSAKANF